MIGMLRPLHPKNMAKHVSSNEARLRRHQRIRRSLIGTETRPRLNVFRSGEHIYAQLIDDTTGNTIVSASSLEESLREFKTAQSKQSEQQTNPSLLDRMSGAVQTVAEFASNLRPGQEQEATPASARSGQQRGGQQQKGGQAKGGQPQKGGKATPAKMVLPAAQKGAKKTPVEALAPIANNRKVAIAREVGKLVAQRAKEKGVTTIVFDRGGYAYHGRVASLAEGAREAGLDF